MKAILFFLIVSSLGAWEKHYEVNDTEHRTLLYIFGYEITAHIESHVWLTDSKGNTGGGRACYGASTDAIYVFYKYEEMFRSSMMISHEGTHLFQRDYFHDNRESDLNGYNTDFSTLGSVKLGVEAEAEVVRTLAELFAEDGLNASMYNSYYGEIDNDVFTDLPHVPDTAYVRNSLWVYIENAMNLQRPSLWWYGIPKKGGQNATY